MQHAFKYISLMLAAKRRRGSFRLEVLTTTRAQSTKSFILAFTWKQFVPIKGKTFRKTWPTWNDRKIIKLPEGSSLKWSFRCNSRRSFLNSLLLQNCETNCIKHYTPIVQCNNVSHRKFKCTGCWRESAGVSFFVWRRRRNIIQRQKDS